MKFKIRYASQVVGVFVILAVLFLAGILILMGVNQRWFAKNYYFTSRFASGGGLSIGLPISFKGFEIGKVTKIALAEDNTVEIKFYIRDTFYPKVFENSVLQLTSNPLGLGGGLVFHQGSNPSPPLEEFSYIPSLDLPEGREKAGLGLAVIPREDDAINRILGEIDPILINANLFLLSINELLSSLNSGLAGKTSSPLGKIVADLGSVTGSVSGSLDETLAATNVLLGNLTEITANLKATTESLRDPRGLIIKLLEPKGSIATFLDDNNRLFDEVEKILKSAAESMDEVQSFAAFINSTHPQLLGMLEEGRQTVRLGQDVLEGLKNNPLLRGGITPKTPIPTTQQGYRDEAFR